MMYQCSFTAHLVLVSRMYIIMHVCHTRAARRSGLGRGGKLALENPGECKQYAGQRVRMSFAG